MTTKTEQRYMLTIELTDGGKRVVWDDMPCYATSPQEAVRKTLAGYTPRAKALAKSVADESGSVVWTA